MSRCGIVILAAGASTRMGVAKQSLAFEGSTLLLRAVETAIASVCRPIVVVLGSQAHDFQTPLQGKPVEIVLNENWAAGMGTSIRAGISAIRSNPIDAAMIFLCDQPLISAAVLNQMVAAHFKAAQPMTAAFYANTFGTPAIFSADLFDELLALENTRGGKALFQRHPNQVQPFPLPEAEIDIDRPEDFARLVDRVDL